MTVTAADVVRAVDAARAALLPAVDRDWSVPAGPVEWSCRRTAEHIADDLVSYAAQVASERQDGYVAIEARIEDRADARDVLEVVTTAGRLLAAAVAAAPATARGWQPAGMGDAEAFAAMGIVEVLAHTHDIAQGLGVGWSPPADLAAMTLQRLFPDRPDHPDPYAALLWCTGRGELPGKARKTRWRWWNDPADWPKAAAW
jgi:hypothetical protein